MGEGIGEELLHEEAVEGLQLLASETWHYLRGGSASSFLRLGDLYMDLVKPLGLRMASNAIHEEVVGKISKKGMFTRLPSLPS